MHLYGREWTRDQFERYVGDISQAGGVTRYIVNDGPAAGVEVAEFRTGTGLRFDVLLTRGMDIGGADYCGIPLAWRSGTGYVHPAYFDPQDDGWLRTLQGGLLVTCGLTHIGAAGFDKGRAPGLPGRASLPANNVCIDTAWHDDEYVMTVRGVMRQISELGAKVQLTRQITAWLGSSLISITDTVENLAFTPVEHMLLYHLNLGYPLISPESHIIAPPHQVTPRDAQAAVGMEQWASFDMPTAGFAERVYFHEMPADDDHMVTVAIAAPQVGPKGTALQLRYDTRTLPYFTQWKMCGEGMYALGLEPGNARVSGWAAEPAAGRLQVLGPRETRRYTLFINVESMW